MDNGVSLEELMKRWSGSALGKNMDRRDFIQGASKLAGLSLGLALAQSVTGMEVNAAPKFRDYPFTLGVASGDPLPDSVVLWTRLAPDPLNGGGMAPQPVQVKWQIARDEHFRKVVQEGKVAARPELGHSVHVEVEGLKSEQIYYYRFKSGGETSQTGRTKTLPAAGTDIKSMKFAFASCQQFEHGYFTAYKHLAKEDLDLVFHLGDYIYEYGPNEYISPSGNVRMHSGPEIIQLEDYRNRYAQYRSDSHLRAAHAAFPWVVTWDDHEVENNYANLNPEKGQSVEAFIKRRAAAYQAYYEHMPLRKSSLPEGSDMRLYRDFSYGNLASFFVLDSRQYRDDQANGDGSSPQTPESLDPSRTLLGEEQEQWLTDRLGKSETSWNVLPQQIFFSERNYATLTSPKFSMDSWDGYPAARERLMKKLKEKGTSNLVVLTGDVHASWACEIKEDFIRPDSRTVGVEFVGTSITSGGNGADKRADTDKILSQNPHIKFFNDYRGYVRCTLTKDQWRADYRVLPFVTEPGADISTRASFIYQKDQAGLQKIASIPVPEGIQMTNEVEEDRTTAHNRAHEKQRKRMKITQ
ncbi:alkaline phosphatase D family protein [Peribacillus sp. SCS-26]|uniref:alkaline phosphatase D family protein n=1 Tax=Paraperibacillus marinus TaxID=3115295 RepID=UPI003906C1C5